MKRITLLACLLWAAATLAGCGEVRHVFPPTVTLDQLATPADGPWQASVRLHNQSWDAGVRFDQVKLTLQVNGQAAGTLQAQPALDVPERSADVVGIAFQPGPAAREALAATPGQRLQYSLSGQLTVSNAGKNPHAYDVDHQGWLSPVPGLPNQYR